MQHSSILRIQIVSITLHSYLPFMKVGIPNKARPLRKNNSKFHFKFSRSNSLFQTIIRNLRTSMHKFKRREKQSTHLTRQLRSKETIMSTSSLKHTIKRSEMQISQQCLHTPSLNNNSSI